MNSTATTAAAVTASASSRRNRRAMRQSAGGGGGGGRSVGGSSVGSGSAGGTTTATTTAAEARRNRIAGTGVPASPKANANAAANAAAASSVRGNSRTNTTGPSANGSGSASTAAASARLPNGRSQQHQRATPTAADVAAAFEDLGMMPSTAAGGGAGGSSNNGEPSGPSGSRRTSAASTRNGSVRRSGNTILSSKTTTAAAAAAAPTPTAGSRSGIGGTSSGHAPNATTATRTAVPSPQDVAEEFVGRRRLQQQQQLQQQLQQQQQQQQGPAGMSVTMSNTRNADANAARNHPNHPAAVTSPARSRNAAAVRNYVSSTSATATATATAAATAKTNAASTTPARYALAAAAESPSQTQTPGTSNRRQQPLRVDTTRPGGGAGTGAAATSPDTHLGSVNSSELGSLASPPAGAAGADSLAYSQSQNTSQSGSALGGGSGGGGFGFGFGGDDLLSGQATNDIPSTRTRTAAAAAATATATSAKATTNMSGAGRVGTSTSNGEWATATQPHSQSQAQAQPRLQMRSGAPSPAARPTTAAAGRTPTADSVDDTSNFDDGTHGGGSISSRYDDLTKLSSGCKHTQDRVMAPVDERPHLVNPNGTSRSFDSYENKSHATAIVYGNDASGVGAAAAAAASFGGAGAGNAAAATGGGGAARDGTSIDVVTQSFSPTQQSNGHSASQISVGGAGGGRPQGTFDDEDTNTVGSQLTDDRSWSRSVNLRQQHLRAQGRDYDDDADSRGSRRRRKSGKDGGKDAAGEGDLTGWALNADDLNHFKEQVDQPQVKAALGASAAVVAGAAIFGPAGVLLGAAAVGFGVGVMQIPEDQRDQMKEKATAAAQQTYESAQIAADAMGTTCATACVESGVAEKIDPKFAKFVEDGAQNGCGTTIAATDLVQHNPCIPMEGDSLSSPADGESVVGGAASASKNGARATNGQSNGVVESSADDSGSENQMPKRRRKVACMRKGRIISIGQIHSLAPSRQPKAWLDVMSSANTSRDEKDEAMEELSIFIKDKYTAHLLLDEGILDSLLYIIACFFRNQGSAIAKDVPDGILPMSIRSDPEFLHAKKAASCCVNLGKAHCAIVHTEADDLLMSAYSNGAVPMERQLAQMLHEIPHHTSLPTTPANKQAAEGGDVSSSSEIVFTLTELSLQHAERLATSILALSQGRVVF